MFSAFPARDSPITEQEKGVVYFERWLSAIYVIRTFYVLITSEFDMSSSLMTW